MAFVRSRFVALCAAIAALALTALGSSAGAETSGGVSAPQGSEVVLRPGDRGKAVRQVQRRLDVRATGYYGRMTTRAVQGFQRGHYLRADGRVGTLTRQALGLPPFPPESVVHPAVRLPRVLELIADCESGGDPTAVSRDGRYRGKYQFTRATWLSLGGRGDPARAPERTQDRLALRLYRKRGTRPWPHCAQVARATMRRS